MPGQVAPVADEREGLLRYLAMQRDLLRNAAFGLSDEQARQAPSASSLTIGGLLKHVASTETNWIDMITSTQADPGAGPDRDNGRAASDYGEDFRMGEGETLDALLQRSVDVAARTEAVIAGVTDLGQPVPVPKGGCPGSRTTSTPGRCAGCCCT